MILKLKIIIATMCILPPLLLQSTVAHQLPLAMASLDHIEIQLRVLRFPSVVAHNLFQAHQGWLPVEQMGGGTLTLALIGAHVSVHP